MSPSRAHSITRLPSTGFHRPPFPVQQAGDQVFNTHASGDIQDLTETNAYKGIYYVKFGHE